MPLPSVDAVKSRLDIPDTNVKEDPKIAGFLTAAKLRVSKETKLDFVAQPSVTEIFRNVVVGEELFLGHRPVSSITSASSRVSAQTPTWSAVECDLVDPALGLVIFPVASFKDWVWGSTRFASRARRKEYFDILRVIYATTAYDPPQDLVESIQDLAAYWYELAHSAGVVSQGADGINLQYDTMAIPHWIQAVISSYVQRRAISV